MNVGGVLVHYFDLVSILSFDKSHIERTKVNDVEWFQCCDFSKRLRANFGGEWILRSEIGIYNGAFEKMFVRNDKLLVVKIQ